MTDKMPTKCFTLTEDLVSKLAEAAKKNDESESRFVRRAIEAEIRHQDPRRERRRQQAYVRRQKKKAAAGELTDFDFSCELASLRCIEEAYWQHIGFEETDDTYEYPEAPDNISNKIYDAVVKEYREAWCSVADPFDIDETNFDEATDFAWNKATDFALNRINELAGKPS